VRKLCSLLAVGITCDSQPGDGSAFVLQVPRGDNDLVQRKPPASTPVSMAGVRVLVIDDERDILTSMRHLLGSWGCFAMTAESAEEALEEIARSGLQPDLIMADYRLRENKTGAQAIQAIRQACGHEIPAMILTGDTSKERLQEANASGFYLLHKPVAPGRLRFTMNQLLTLT
ncbi:MAG: response regulator, partial [Thiothrix litoralis]